MSCSNSDVMRGCSYFGALISVTLLFENNRNWYKYPQSCRRRNLIVEEALIENAVAQWPGGYS